MKAEMNVASTIEPTRPGRAPRIVFGLMSAQQPAETVAQLVDTLAPHPVWVHHDFAKRADFALERTHVRLVPKPKATGWGTWGFVQAIVHTIETALAADDFDYFQLLSPTCLPIRPVAEFVRHIESDPADVHADLMAVDQEPDWLMTFGYRLFVPAQSRRFRALRWLRRQYFGADPELLQFRSLSILKRRERGGGLSPLEQWALYCTQQAARGRLGTHPFNAALRPVVGSVWFGARRSACETLVRMARDAGVQQRFSRLHLVDETFFASLIGNAGLRVAPSNHVISAFNERGHPRWLDDSDWTRLIQSGRYFARKFPESPDAPVRQQALARLQAARVET